MKITFISPDPHKRARPLLDDVLEKGVDQIAIACAFLTGGGVELLKRHAARLRSPSSFVVVAWAPPTTLDVLNELYAVIPGNLYVHLGKLTPVEPRVGSGLMHSKVFFANAGPHSYLWTGSHNLTASAVQGVNLEAAVLLEGASDHAVFADALAHLNQCRAEAIPFDPWNPPPPPHPEQILVIHAECDEPLKRLPSHVHFRPAGTDCDGLMRPPATVWVYLYPRGTLRRGQRRPQAMTCYSGILTALNFTEKHPTYSGISAAWSAADYVIDSENDVFWLRAPRPNPAAQTQGLLSISAEEDRETVWLSESPEAKVERVVGSPRVSKIDDAYRKFFTKSSLSPDGLVHQEYRGLRRVARMLRNEVGSHEASDLQVRLAMPIAAELIIDEGMAEDDKHAFVYRAKYRVPPRERDRG